MSEIERLKKKLNRGQITRREFLSRMSAISAAAVLPAPEETEKEAANIIAINNTAKGAGMKAEKAAAVTGSEMDNVLHLAPILRFWLFCLSPKYSLSFPSEKLANAVIFEFLVLTPISSAFSYSLFARLLSPIFLFLLASLSKLFKLEI